MYANTTKTSISNNTSYECYGSDKVQNKLDDLKLEQLVNYVNDLRTILKISEINPNK